MYASPLKIPQPRCVQGSVAVDVYMFTASATSILCIDVYVCTYVCSHWSSRKQGKDQNNSHTGSPSICSMETLVVVTLCTQ